MQSSAPISLPFYFFTILPDKLSRTQWYNYCGWAFVWTTTTKKLSNVVRDLAADWLNLFFRLGEVKWCEVLSLLHWNQLWLPSGLSDATRELFTHSALLCFYKGFSANIVKPFMINHLIKSLIAPHFHLPMTVLKTLYCLELNKWTSNSFECQQKLIEISYLRWKRQFGKKRKKTKQENWGRFRSCLSI